jgi:hypothetical protein
MLAMIDWMIKGRRLLAQAHGLKAPLSIKFIN